jgi:hypothetical protein
VSVIEGYDPVDESFQVVATGVEFDAATHFTAGVSRMRQVPDGIGTAPIGVRLSPSGDRVYVFNYLARNVVATGAALPLGVTGKPENFRCASAEQTRCGTNNDCPGGVGFCNHPGGGALHDRCGLRYERAVRPLRGVRAPAPRPGGIDDHRPVRGWGRAAGTQCKGNADCTAGGTCNGIAGDPLPAKLLDGKILFNTAARDSSVPNGVGLGQAAPLFNAPRLKCAGNPSQPCMQDDDCGWSGSVQRRRDDAGRGREHLARRVLRDLLDLPQRLRRPGRPHVGLLAVRRVAPNTMDLRGRAGFAPGTCSNAPAQECFFDAACGDGNTLPREPGDDPAQRHRSGRPRTLVQPDADGALERRPRRGGGLRAHVPAAPGRRADCDAAEDVSTCQGALVQRSPLTSTDPVDVSSDLGRPNRNIPGPITGKNVGIRLSNMADFVYSLTTFVKNPNQPNEVTDRGRALFNDPVTQCADCHNGGPGAASSSSPTSGRIPISNTAAPGRADSNNPFIRHDVGTRTSFDTTNPLAVALDAQIFQNPRIPIPGERGSLGDYVTPMLNDLWNTAPYLHDG